MKLTFTLMDELSNSDEFHIPDDILQKRAVDIDLIGEIIEQARTLAIHEFGHSFVNHLLETTAADLIKETSPLYEPISTGMSAQGCPEWSYAITEHFVRAGEVLIPELLNDTAMSDSTLQWNTKERSFIYLPFIVERLRTYRITEGLSYELSIRNTMEDLKSEYLQ